MEAFNIPFWKTAPFSRLLLPLIAGICLQYYFPQDIKFILTGIGCYSFSLILFALLGISSRFYFYKVQGGLIQILIFIFALLITWNNCVKNQDYWFGNKFKNGDKLLLTINEPLVKKQKSYRSIATVNAVSSGGMIIKSGGQIIVYFALLQNADTILPGSLLIIDKPLQAIRNSGNPGGFNYQAYAAFQQQYYSVYLAPSDFIVLKGITKFQINNLLVPAREYVLKVIRKYLPQEKSITGLAEALLIGYKEDLDKDLVQAYSNTGVVHIIAISGLHLGLIYMMLVFLFDNIPGLKRSKLLKVILILGFLWIFSLLTGGSASVLRSAVMFTCIVIGKNFFKQSSIYNSLASSAFILLCYDPYFLWDAGFQLSYCAVYGIVWLQKPIHGLIYVKNKWLDKIWQMLSVSLAAQIITFPVCLYYFHQFPNTFLFTNFTSVPLSTLILFVEIFIIAFSWLPLAASTAGKLCYLLIWIMNSIVRFFSEMPYSKIANIHLDSFATICLYLFILQLAGYLTAKKRGLLYGSLLSVLMLTGLLTRNIAVVSRQKKMIVYNIPKASAVDFISGEQYYFNGDEALRSMNRDPASILSLSRIFYSANDSSTQLPGLRKYPGGFHFYGSEILVLKTSFTLLPQHYKIKIKALIISNNASVTLKNLTAAIDPEIVIFDASNSMWKIAAWKKECEELHLPGFSVPEQGAFIMDLP